MILGALLAGGRSSRFGSDKALALWEGRPLIEHVAERLGGVCDAVIVCGRSYGELPFVPDRPAPDLGPLGGLSAALHHAAAHGFERAISAPCDAPLLSNVLLAALAATSNAFLADLPVIGCWNGADAERLDLYLATQDDRSMRAWARTIGATALPLAAPANVNHPADMAALRR